MGWTESIEKLLHANGMLKLEDDEGNAPNKTAWELCRNYFHPWHPIDWSEEFHIGPTHGDLNLGNILLHEKGDGLFPWLIDFDKAEDDRPIVFDLAKLEIEAYHKIAQELFWELRHLGCVENDLGSRNLLHRFERALQFRRISDVSHLWSEFEDSQKAVPQSLKRRFEGLFSYLKQVHKRVEDLGVGEREFTLGRAVYAMSCLKFKHLYRSTSHPNAPFPAKVVLWKLEALLTALDESNGIQHETKTRSAQEAAVWKAVSAIREARYEGSEAPLMSILSPIFSEEEFTRLKNLPEYESDDDWTALLRILRDKHLSGRNRWMRELLWYARDLGLADAKEPNLLAEFTKAMVLASQPTGTKFPKDRTDKEGVGFVDYASTGRPGNTFPSLKMLEHLAEQQEKPLIKISSRGESGGTIDILEKAGIPICRSKEAVNASLENHQWALVETSEALGEIDKILMKLRKECGCMKVDELAMTSISAKKALLGIRNFEVQVVTGYDAKLDSLLENGEKGSDISQRWSAMWQAVYENGSVTTPFFDSDRLASWRGDDEDSLIVFGQKLLAAKIWSDLGSGNPEEVSAQQQHLKARLPAEFSNEMEELAKSLHKVRVAANEKANENKESSCPKHDWILNLSRIFEPGHLKAGRCEELKCVTEMNGFQDLSAILFSFGSPDTFAKLHIPYFDSLFSEISASGHPMASLLFGKNWMVVMRPRSDLPDDLQAWCWRILRDGFDDGHSE
ncbi:MAG: lipopolysaccharide kinase InaA family protein [Verrucomicrobiota bacterium]